MKKNKIKILYLDIEIIPDLRATLLYWPYLSNGFWSTTLRASVTSICSFGYMDNTMKKPKCKNAWNFPNWKKNINDDSALCKFIVDLISKYDVVVTQNGKKFDIPFIQTRLLKHQIPFFPPKTIQADTKEISKRNLLLISNSLKHQAEFFTKERKMENEGWGLWIKTHDKVPSAMRMMSKYCKQDVKTLGEIAKPLFPLVNNLPNPNRFSDGLYKICTNSACGSVRLIKKRVRELATKTVREYQCKDCGKYSYETLKSNKVLLKA